MQSFENGLDAFIAEARTEPFNHRAWIKAPEGQIYLRWGERLFDLKTMKRVRCLDVSYIIIKDNFQHKGVFKRFIEYAEQHADAGGFYIFTENVTAPWFIEFFKKRGYIEKVTSFGSCLHRVNKDEER